MYPRLRNLSSELCSSLVVACRTKCSLTIRTAFETPVKDGPQQLTQPLLRVNIEYNGTTP